MGINSGFKGLRVEVQNERQCTYQLKRFSETIVAMKKTISVTYSECVSVTLFIQNAKRMRLIVRCEVCPAATHF